MSASIPRALFNDRLLRVLFFATILIELYTVAVLPTFTSTQEARKTAAEADNAIKLHKAVANLAEAKAINQTEIAANAERKQLAEAKRATALADKTRYEADAAAADAHYADALKKAEAAKQGAAAEFTRQMAGIKETLNLYVDRMKRAEACKAKLQALDAKLGLAGGDLPDVDAFLQEDGGNPCRVVR